MVHWFDKSVRRNTLKKVSSNTIVQSLTGILCKDSLPRLWATTVMLWGKLNHILLRASKQFSVIKFPTKSKSFGWNVCAWKQKKKKFFVSHSFSLSLDCVYGTLHIGSTRKLSVLIPYNLQIYLLTHLVLWFLFKKILCILD